MTAVVEASGVQVQYSQPGGAVRALDNVDLRVERSEFVFIKGESGSGKSTLLSLLGAVSLPTSGTIEVLGESLTNASAARLTEIRRDKIGFVFQDFRLIRHLSALENVRLPLLFREERGGEADPEALLARFRMDHRANHKPGELSRGEMQRVALARALVMGPEFLIADEPTANLDTANARVFWELLSEHGRADDLTVVVATHGTPGVEADRVVRLHDGRIVE